MTDILAIMLAPAKTQNPDIRDLFLARQKRNKEMKQNILFAVLAVAALAAAIIVTH